MTPKEYFENVDCVERFFLWLDTDDFLGKYKARKKALRAVFEGYRTATGENRAVMDQLLTGHAALCKRDRKPDAKRRHNTFVLRYVAGASPKKIAYQANTSTATVFRDISIVFDTMMVLAFGVEGLIPYEYVPVFSPEEYEGQ